ncbi:hypothetical protein BTVI_87375 [Pitangus sulphuratus]|nr:hypothetical protein BTVI_87375 [Pitangus sulphuratus]
MPASSKMEPAKVPKWNLAKAKPISNAGSDSVITYLRRGEKTCCGAAAERGVRIHERNIPAEPKGPADLWKEEPTLEQVYCEPMGDPNWSSLFLKDCTTWKGPTLEQFVKNCSLWEGLTLENFMEESLVWEGPHGAAGEEHEESSHRGGRSKRKNM